MIAYVCSIWSYRHFWLSLVHMDLRNRYRRSYLGIGWSLLHPLAMTALLCCVFHKSFHLSAREYAPYLMVSICLWSFVQAMVSQGCQCFLLGSSYIRQSSAPLAIYSLRTTLSAGVHAGIAIGAATLLARVFSPAWSLPATAALVTGLGAWLIFGWAVATLAGLLTVYFPDTPHLLEISLQGAFYITPILYPASLLHENGMGWLAQWNPLVALLDWVRCPALSGQAPTLGVMAVGFTFVITLAVFAGLVLARHGRRVVFLL